MSAVLEEAIRCFQTCLLAPDKQRKKLFCEAERWLMEDDTGALVSFPEVCELLGLDTGYIRRGLRRWQAAQTSALLATTANRLSGTGPVDLRRAVHARIPPPCRPLAAVESAPAGSPPAVAAHATCPKAGRIFRFADGEPPRYGGVSR